MKHNCGGSISTALRVPTALTLALAAGLTGCATARAPAPPAPGGGQAPAAAASIAPRAAERADAFVVHISDTRRSPVRLAPLRPCTDTAAPSAGCGEITPLSPDGSTWQVRRRRSRGATTPGAVWEEAYRIREDLGVARVEPAFEFDQGEWGIEDGPRARGGRSRPDKCGARRDPEWSLKYIHVPQAWAALRRDRGRPDGEEGARVVVAHIDTGYRKHPELWSADPTVSRLLVADGYDFVGKDDDALDELDTGGLVPNPGHGTKSGSVIASPKGKQWSGDCGAVGPDCDGAVLSADNCYVSGVAPGARLIPLRVHRSVVHFVPTEMARAIYAASGPDRSLVKKQAGAISISMGGSPSWALWKAVRYARDQGVIVVAAAGNEVGFVVWPARFKETIAVAASNVDCAMWDGSSRGDAVDITAPGESVWRADAAPDDSVGMGQGTTFATATTAGLAALWLDYHDGDPQIARLKSAGLLTEGFRRALQASSWTPAHPPSGVTCARTDWDPRRQGPGIANAAGLLAFDLRTFPGGPMAPSRGGPETLDELPLFASLFADGTAPAEVRLRYGRLLGLSAPEDLQTETVQLEGEILDHYAHDARVRAALDALAAAPPPSEEAYQGARAALLARDLSPTLRRALAQRGPQP